MIRRDCLRCTVANLNLHESCVTYYLNSQDSVVSSEIEKILNLDTRRTIIFINGPSYFVATVLAQVAAAVVVV